MLCGGREEWESSFISESDLPSLLSSVSTEIEQKNHSCMTAQVTELLAPERAVNQFRSQ